MGFPGETVVKNPPANAEDTSDAVFCLLNLTFKIWIYIVIYHKILNIVLCAIYTLLYS